MSQSRSYETIAMPVYVQMPHKHSSCGNLSGRKPRAAVTLGQASQSLLVSYSEIKCEP